MTSLRARTQATLNASRPLSQLPTQQGMASVSSGRSSILDASSSAGGERWLVLCCSIDFGSLTNATPCSSRYRLKKSTASPSRKRTSRMMAHSWELSHWCCAVRSRRTNRPGRSAHKAKTVTYANANTNAILGEKKVEAVVLEDGTRIPADLVIMAVGIKPNAALAKQAGIDVGRGIKVGADMRTSDSDIFAVGECAEAEGQVFGLVAPLYEMAGVIAAQLTGDATDR